MDGFRGAVDAVAAILRRVLLRDPSNRREACTWLAALIGRVQLPPALRRALVCRLVARSGSLDPGEAVGKERLSQNSQGPASLVPHPPFPLPRPSFRIPVFALPLRFSRTPSVPTPSPAPCASDSSLNPLMPLLPRFNSPHPHTSPMPLPFPPSSPTPSKSSPGASDRSLLRQLLQLLCEERPKDAARLLMHDPDLIRSFFAANPHRILLWFDHFSLGPGSQGGRWGEEGERSREQQRPSAYAATAYAGSGSGSAHTKLAGSAAAGDALHRDSPGSGRLVLPTRALVRNHRFGAQALAEFAFAHREDHWHRLVWAGKHAQTPVTVAARPHYFCELDISGTMKNFLREVPEFWLVREMEDERRRRGWEEGVEEVLRTERREGDGRDVRVRKVWIREERMQAQIQIQEERRGRQGREMVHELVEDFVDSVDWALLCSRVLAGAGEEGLESVARGVWRWAQGRRGEEGGGPDRREGGRKREDGRERERGIERERGRLKEGGGDGWAGARERRGREGRVIEMGVGAGMVEAQGMMDEVLIGACWDGDEERIRGGRREEDEEWSRRERRERDKERNSRRARDVKADQLASLPSLDSLSSFERLLLLVAGACHGRQTALLLLREPEWADEREELTAVLRGCFATSVGEPPGKQLVGYILGSGGVEEGEGRAREGRRRGEERERERQRERGREWEGGEESIAGIEVVVGTWMVRAHLMASMGMDGGHTGMDDDGLAGMGCLAGGDEAVGVMLRRLGVAVERGGGEGGMGEVGGEGGVERVGDGEGGEKRRKREMKKEKKGRRGKLLLGPLSVTCSTRELSDAVADGLLRLCVLSKELIG
ncbi:unnamed protein product [Closterium sp. NIES-65]|nr:unnamed protein product [Closterium sp. NIES-65]